MSAIGVDLGSLLTVIALVKNGGVEVISNEASYRETPNMVGYGSQERLLGEMAKAKMKSNFKNTISFFTRVLNLEMNSPELAFERKHIFCRIVPGPTGKVAFSIDYQGEQLVVTPEQVLAAHFNKIVSTLKFNDIDSREFVVTYPNFFSQQEKEAMFVAARIANVKLTRIVSETEVNVKNYGIYRRGDIKDTKRIVLFVDVGHSKTSVYLSEFTKDKAVVLYENHNRHLGARDLDLLLYDTYQKQFEKESGHLVDENPKARMRLMEAIERQRKLLSANSEAGCNVEYLVEEDDFNANLTRDQFEKLCSPVFERFQGFLVHCLSESKINIAEVHSVELIGGATRIPLLQTIIQQIAQKESISKTLNQSENCSRGAAIVSAEVSTFFKVAAYPVILKNQFPIKCTYLVQKDDAMVEKSGTLFKYGAEIPLNMSITLPKTKQTSFAVAYEDQIPHRSIRELFLVDTQPINPKHEDYKLILRTCIDDNSLVTLKAVELEENFLEDQKKPKEKKVEGEEDFEMVKVKKTHTSNVSFNLQKAVPVSDEDIARWAKLESEMIKRDNVILETNKIKNDVESLIYKCKDNLKTQWAEYISDEEVRRITQKYHEVENWVQNEGQNAGKDAYTSRVNELNDLILPVTERLKNHTQFSDAALYLHNKIQLYSQEVGEIEKNVSFAQKFMNLMTFKVKQILTLDREVRPPGGGGQEEVRPDAPRRVQVQAGT